MKIKLVPVATLIAALSVTMHAPAQPATPTSDEQHSRDRDVYQNNQHRLGKLEKASKLIGMEVKNSQDQKLGKVKDLAVDLQNGRIVEVVVGTGGMLGMDERFTAVPPSQFTCDEANKTLRLNVEKDRFTSAPSFKGSTWDENEGRANIAEVYQYYNVHPYFSSEVISGKTNPGMTHELGEVQRASKLMDTPTRNTTGEKLGKIENLVVDLPAGRVVEVIVASGGFLGMGDELSAVPPQAFHHGVERDSIILDTTKDTLTRAPHFKSREWPDLNSPDYNHVDSVYRAYNVEPYYSATNAVDNTAQNVRDRQDNSLTPLNQGSSEADMNTTQRIRQQIMSADGFSIDARNVKVITIDGRVTLRGPVDSMDEKRQITDIANKVATQGNVDNQLEVKDNTNSNK